MNAPATTACSAPYPLTRDDSDAWASARRAAGHDVHRLHIPDLEAQLGGLRPRMRSVARGIVRNTDAAEDVVQNAFEKALRGLHGFDGRARLSTWVHRIVVNESLMWLRSESRRRKRFELESESGIDADRHADPGGDPSQPLFERERAGWLRAGLASLPAAERDVLEHCALAGESYEAYGRRAGIGSAAAKSRAYRGRQRLRTWLRHA